MSVERTLPCPVNTVIQPVTKTASATDNSLDLVELAQQAMTRSGGEPAVQFQGEWISFAELSRLARQTRECLQAAELEPGIKVAFVARNHPSALAAFIGILAGGFSVRMIYPFQSAGAIAREIDALEPAAVVADQSDFSAQLVAVLESKAIGGVALSGMQVMRIVDGANLKAAVSNPPTIEILTSGTTGKPKPFTLDYPTIATHFVGAPAPGLKTGSIPVLLYFPIGNISGLYSTLPALLQGQQIILLDRFRVEDWHAYVKTYRPAVGGMPPAAIQMVLDADIPKEDLSSLKMLGAGAAPLDPDVQRRFEERYGIPILLSYGATEFGGPVTRMTPEMYQDGGRDKVGSVGKAIPGCKLRVVDPETFAPLPAGEEGILEVVSPRIGPQWIRTSDLAVIDDEGYLFHRGRADGAIVRGGFKILPETIEKALLKHAQVSAVSVVGLKDPRLGQVPVAAVVLKPGAENVTVEALERHLREHVLATHIPVQWKILDTLPRTALSYKVDQAAVRALFDR